MAEDIYSAISQKSRPDEDDFSFANDVTDCLEERDLVLCDVMQRRKKQRVSIDQFSAIDWHMTIPCSMEKESLKRCRTESDNGVINRITERILLSRKKRKKMEGKLNIKDVHEAMSSSNKSILRFPPVDGSTWIGVSTPDHFERYYLKLKESSNLRKIHRTMSGEISKRLNSRTIDVILKEAEVISDHRIVTYIGKDSAVTSIPTSPQSDLWVDKYAPKAYADLLSDDRLNRALLRFMKLWDECVFGRKISNNSTSGDKLIDSIVLDSGKPPRPFHKIVLLCGPAGLGKTTLSSIVARHAGYRVIEMNASDDRNVADFESKIEGAIRVVRTLDSDPRPCCLVVDEIDGAPIQSIRYLWKTATASGRKAIRRPIICICNNLYKPSLRELRSVSLVLQMPPANPIKLQKRVEQIASSEMMSIDKTSIVKLVNACDCDLRSVINALQFLSSCSSSKYIDSGTIETYNKNTCRLGDRTLFDIWALVLELGRHKDTRGNVANQSLRCRQVEIVVSQCSGEVDRFYAGLFANYLNRTTRSILLSNVSKASQQFGFIDQLWTVIMRHQNYSLIKYTFAVSVTLHLLLASPTRIQLAYPSSEQDLAQRRKNSHETLTCVKNVYLSHYITNEILLLHVLPLLIYILQPPLKSVNTQLYSTLELDLMHSLITVMRSFYLTYKAIFTEGGIDFVFSPPIDVLVMFPVECRDCSLVLLGNNIRQMIAHEIDLAQMRGSDDAGLTKYNSIEQIDSLFTGKKIHNGISSAGEVYSKGVLIRETRLKFRYNQGFSNAIRRTIVMGSLIF